MRLSLKCIRSSITSGRHQNKAILITGSITLLDVIKEIYTAEASHTSRCISLPRTYHVPFYDDHIQGRFLLPCWSSAYQTLLDFFLYFFDQFFSFFGITISDQIIMIFPSRSSFLHPVIEIFWLTEELNALIF